MALSNERMVSFVIYAIRKVETRFHRRYRRKAFEMFHCFDGRLYKYEAKQGKVCAAEAQYTTIVKENEIKMNEQRKSKHGGVSAKMRAFLKPTGWKPMMILFLFFSFQQFSGIYITLFYAVTWFQVSNLPKFPIRLF